MSLTTSGDSSAVEPFLEQAKAGDPLALGPLLGAYARQLHRIAECRLDEKVRGRVSPSDIVQETLLQATEDFPDFRGDSGAEFRSWLRRILARKLSKNIERHVLAEKRNVLREVLLSGNSQTGRSPVVDHRPGPLSEIVCSERSRQISLALAGLPRSYRVIIELRNLQGLPFEEIAGRLNRTSGAARMLWLRAIDRLRQQLNHQDVR